MEEDFAINCNKDNNLQPKSHQGNVQQTQEDSEVRWKSETKDEEDAAQISHSASTSVLRFVSLLKR